MKVKGAKNIILSSVKYKYLFQAASISGLGVTSKMISIYISSVQTYLSCLAGKWLLLLCHKFTFNIVVLVKNAVDGGDGTHAVRFTPVQEVCETGCKN